MQGWQWASIGLAAPPQPALHAILKTSSPESAHSAADLLARAIAQARQDKQPFLASLDNKNELLDLLKPQAHGDELKLSLDGAQIQRILQALLKAQRAAAPATNPSR